MKILVTGGAGFIASHIVDKYIEQGHEVLVVDNLRTGNLANINPRARFLPKSIDAEEVGQLILAEKPDILSHHAAQVNVRLSVNQPLDDLHVNLQDSVRLFRLAGQAGVKKIIFASSGGTVYGQGHVHSIQADPEPMKEEFRGRPISPYGINKLAAEDYLIFLAQQYQFNWTILRYANVYGPRQSPNGESGVISIFLERLLQGLPPIIYGDGEQVRDFIHVQDVVSANLLVSEIKDKWNGIFNVGVGRGTTINQLVSMLSGILAVSIFPIHYPPQEGDLAWNVLAIEKLLARGWKPSLTLAEGLQQLLQFSK